MMNLKERLINYIDTLDNIRIDSPFKKFPDHIVFRHKYSGKWFGLIMSVEKRKLGIDEDGEIDIIDVKANPEIISLLIKAPGYFPAYHMNKNHWITLLLDGTIKEKQLVDFIKDSYDLTS